MNNNEINPRLKELLERLQETPARDSQRHEAGRVNFLSWVKNIQPRQTPTRTSKTRVGTSLKKSWLPSLATILAVACLLYPASVEPSTPPKTACRMICFIQ